MLVKTVGDVRDVSVKKMACSVVVIIPNEHSPRRGLLSNPFNVLQILFNDRMTKTSICYSDSMYP